MEENIEPTQGSEGSSGEAGAEQNVNAEQPETAQQGEVSKEVSKDARMWAMLCHLLAIFTGFIAPLIIWLVKKEDDPFIDNQGKEALNFQITVAIAMLVAWLLCFACIGFVLVPAVWIVDIVFCIIASVKANNGVAYRYPLTIRFIK